MVLYCFVLKNKKQVGITYGLIGYNYGNTFIHSSIKKSVYNIRCYLPLLEIIGKRVENYRMGCVVPSKALVTMNTDFWDAKSLSMLVIVQSSS